MTSLLSWRRWTKGGLCITSACFGWYFGAIALIFASFALLILIVFEHRFKIYIPTNLAIVFVLFILMSLFLGSYHNFYEKFSWWDDVLHAFYGGAFAVIGFIIIQVLSERRGIVNDPLIVCLFSLCFSIACGALWEVYEFGYDSITGGNMQRTDQGNGVSDTMHDIILESSTALVVNMFIYFYLVSGTQNWVARISEQFIAANRKNTAG